MTTGNRDLRATITIGGGVAASVPRSAREARRELGQLTRAQNDDKAAVAGLRAEMQRLAQAGQRGGAQYRALSNQVESATSRIANRTGTIATLNGRLMGTQAGGLAADRGIRAMGSGIAQTLPQAGPFSQILGGLGPAGVAAGLGIGIAAGAALALGAAVVKTTGETTALLEQIRTTGAESEGFQRLAGLFDPVTSSIQEARDAAAQTLERLQQLREQRDLGRQLPIEFVQAAGNNLDDLLSGDTTRQVQALVNVGLNTESETILSAFGRSFGRNTEELLRALQTGDIDQAEANRLLREANVLTPDQIRQQAAVHEATTSLRDSLQELRTAVVNALLPGLGALVRAIDNIPGVNASDAVRQFDRVELLRRENELGERVARGELTPERRDALLSELRNEQRIRREGPNVLTHGAGIGPRIDVPATLSAIGALLGGNRAVPAVTAAGSREAGGMSVEINQTFNGIQGDPADIGDAVLVALSHARLS